jgi:DNA-binding NtrC family response regulator
MSKRSIFVCVQKDIVHPLNWSFKEFGDRIAVKYFDKINKLGETLANEDCSVLILDSIVSSEPTLDFAMELKNNKPSIKILIVVSIGTTREEILDIIQLKIVSGVLIRPFTVEQVSDYIYKLCGIPKPAEVPWFMLSGKKP